jgi:hypothetical protein
VDRQVVLRTKRAVLQSFNNEQGTIKVGTKAYWVRQRFVYAERCATIEVPEDWDDDQIIAALERSEEWEAFETPDDGDHWIIDEHQAEREHQLIVSANGEVKNLLDDSDDDEFDDEVSDEDAEEKGEASDSEASSEVEHE